jgi:antitoxin VapB
VVRSARASQSLLGFFSAATWAFPDDVHQVDILKIGHSRVIVPQGKRWDDLLLNGPWASDDFVAEREQPRAEERQPL